MEMSQEEWLKRIEALKEAQAQGVFVTDPAISNGIKQLEHAWLDMLLSLPVEVRDEYEPQCEKGEDGKYILKAVPKGSATVRPFLYGHVR